MDTTEQVLSRRDSTGVAVLVACSMLSLISVLGVFVILGSQVSAAKSRCSSDRKLFVRTKVARYLVSLLICNLVQALGGILGIPWIVASRVYVGVACTAQGALKQIGNIGPAIFTFVIAVQTFSLLFLNRDWSNRTCNIVLIVSWAILLLEMCIQHFVSVKPEKGPYYGISTGGYWCWISPKYTTERYATDHLSMIASAVFSLILYSLVFFRLRGNIRVSAGCKFSFHRRPKTGRTTEQIESYLTAVAKHMLWYPIVYITLAIPMAGIRYATYDGKYVDFVITMAISAVFMLHGFFNTVLFSTTRNILPETWRRRFGLGATLGGRRDVSESGATNPTCRDTGASTRDTSTIGTRTFSVVLNIHAEGVKIKSEARPSAEDVKSGSPTSRTLPISLTPSISRIPLFQIYGSSAQPANPDEHHIPRLSPPAPPGSRAGICSKVDEDDKTMAYTGIPLESTAKTVVLGVPEHPGCPSSHHESGAYGPDRV